MGLIATDWRKAGLSETDQALCAYADKVTKSPQAMGAADVVSLREIGLSDRAIHDATQVISYFNYINRIADSLGVAYEDFIQPWEKSD